MGRLSRILARLFGRRGKSTVSPDPGHPPRSRPRERKGLLYQLLYGGKPGPGVTNEELAAICNEMQSQQSGIDRLVRITAAADDAIDALTDLALVEQAYKQGLVPCYVCGDWLDPDDIDDDGTCERCIRWEPMSNFMTERAEADYGVMPRIYPGEYPGPRRCSGA